MFHYQARSTIYTNEALFSDKHLRARRFFTEVNHPEVGAGEFAGMFAKLTKTPGVLRASAPLFGEHTDRVLKELTDKP